MSSSPEMSPAGRASPERRTVRWRQNGAAARGLPRTASGGPDSGERGVGVRSAAVPAVTTRSQRYGDAAPARQRNRYGTAGSGPAQTAGRDPSAVPTEPMATRPAGPAPPPGPRPPRAPPG